MGERRQFFQFHWAFFPGLLFVTASAWIRYGWEYVAVVGAITAVLIGGYYLIWRWTQRRRG